MRTTIVLIAAVLITHASCSSYREVEGAVMRNEIIYAEFHKGGMWIGTIRDPLEIANWELRISADGHLQQRAYDQPGNKWRTFEGKRLTAEKVSALVDLCRSLPSQPTSKGDAVYLGQIATDTTYLHIVATDGESRRDVYLYAPQTKPQGWEQFVRVWQSIARVRPVLHTQSGGI